MASETIQEYEFPWPDENKGYALFPPELENDPLVLFHGTPTRNLDLIIRDGFRAFPPLQSVSYAKNSAYSLTHVIQERENWAQPDGVVIAVRFESLDLPGIANNYSDIHVYDPGLQPKILGYCPVPRCYQHR